MFESRITPVDPQVEIENLRKSYENLKTRHDATLSLNERNQTLKEELSRTIGNLRSENESLLKDVATFEEVITRKERMILNYVADLNSFEEAMFDTIREQGWCAEGANAAIDKLNRVFVSGYTLGNVESEFEVDLKVAATVEHRRSVTVTAINREQAEEMAVEMYEDEMNEWALDEVNDAGWDSIDMETEN